MGDPHLTRSVDSTGAIKEWYAVKDRINHYRKKHFEHFTAAGNNSHGDGKYRNKHCPDQDGIYTVKITKSWGR